MEKVPADKPCYVEWQGDWHEGFILRWWQAQDSTWRAYVEWTTGLGETHRASVPKEQVIPRGIGPNGPLSAN